VTVQWVFFASSLVMFKEHFCKLQVVQKRYGNKRCCSCSSPKVCSLTKWLVSLPHHFEVAAVLVLLILGSSTSYRRCGYLQRDSRNDFLEDSLLDYKNLQIMMPWACISLWQQKYGKTWHFNFIISVALATYQQVKINEETSWSLIKPAYDGLIVGFVSQSLWLLFWNWTWHRQFLLICLCIYWLSFALVTKSY
jgi:hypothetical protein